MLIVTGGAGFIGSAFISKLNAEGVKDIIVVDRLESGVKWQNLNGKKFREIVPPERFLSQLSSEKRSITAIIHLGALSATTETDVDRLLRENVDYSKTLASFALERDVRFIYASSAATYGDGAQGFDDNLDQIDSLRPLNPYGFSKQLVDLWARDQKLFDKIVGIKFFNVFGPNEYHKGSQANWLLRAHQQVKETGATKLFRSYRPDFPNGEQKRDFIYIKDCIQVLWWILQNPTVAGLFNLGTGEAQSWNRLAVALFIALGRKPRIEYVEMPAELVRHYQYFTEARMERLRATGCPLKFLSPEEAVLDYVTHYLEKEHRRF